MLDIEDLDENFYCGDKLYLVKSLLMGVPSNIKVLDKGNSIEAKSDSYFSQHEVSRLLKRLKFLGFKSRNSEVCHQSNSGIKYSFVDDLGTKLKLFLAYTEETKDNSKTRLWVNCY